MSVDHTCSKPGSAGESHVFEYDADTEIGVAVVEAVSTVAGVEPTDLVSLYDVVDPDALDRCVRSAPPEAAISLPFDGYRVTVRGTGTLTVTETG